MSLYFIFFLSPYKCKWNTETGESKVKSAGRLCICYLVKAVSLNQTDVRGLLPAATEMLPWSLPAEEPPSSASVPRRCPVWRRCQSFSKPREQDRNRKVTLSVHFFIKKIYCCDWCDKKLKSLELIRRYRRDFQTERERRGKIYELKRNKTHTGKKEDGKYRIKIKSHEKKM